MKLNWKPTLYNEPGENTKIIRAAAATEFNGVDLR